MFGFINTVSAYINRNSTRLSPLLRCIKFLSQKLGVQIEFDKINNFKSILLNTFNQHSALTNIIIFPVAKLKEGEAIYFPLLVQKDNDELLVLFKRRFGQNYLYDAAADTVIVLPEKVLNSSKVTLWQCCPLHPERITSFKSLLTFISKHSFKVIALGFGFTLLTGLLTIITSYVIAYIGGGNSLININHLLPLLLLITGITLLFYIKNQMISTLGIKLNVQALPHIWNQILNAPLASIQKYSSGEITQCLNDYEIALVGLLPNILTMIFSVFTLIFLFCYMAYCNIYFACLYLLISMIFLSIKICLFPALASNTSMQYQTQGKISGFLNEIFLQIYKIRAANTEGFVFKKWIAYWLELKTQAMHLLRIEILLELISIALPLCFLLAFYACVYFSSHNSNTLWLQLIICVSQFSLIFEAFSKQLFMLFHYLPTLKRLEKLMLFTTPDTDKLSPVKLTGDIVFSQVNYTEIHSNRQILHDINFTVRAGEFVGIIGESGSGKSTILRLLLGFDNISSGSIYLDNFNIKHIDGQTLRKQFGVVLQTSNVFPGTIFDNLTLNKRLTMSAAWHIAEVVGLAEDIELMPMKMHTYISDNPGESISGGQKQKILIARALSTNPSILLLDEATSALDTQSQRTIFEYLKKLQVTRIVIAHRQSTLIGADHVFELRNGRMI